MLVSRDNRLWNIGDAYFDIKNAGFATLAIVIVVVATALAMSSKPIALTRSDPSCTSETAIRVVRYCVEMRRDITTSLPECRDFAQPTILFSVGISSRIKDRERIGTHLPRWLNHELCLRKC